MPRKSASYNLREKLKTPPSPLAFVRELTDGSMLTLDYVQKNGLDNPILVKSKNGLNMKVPGSEFSVWDVEHLIGGQRILDVMDVTTQMNIKMTLSDWVRYYTSPKNERKKRLLNVISLEFTRTPLEQCVLGPEIVRNLDWVELVWPRMAVPPSQRTDEPNPMYPKVRNYCLMSVKGCYTDFHVDFGGTSVWYHVVRGCKVFWLIPPTAQNLTLYEEWVLCGRQEELFFGDIVEHCARVKIPAGATFFIPTGWIHAVFTMEDSLVFGGNFLHSLNIERQLRVIKVEDRTRVPKKYRYPFFTPLLWIVLAVYVYALTGKNHFIQCIPPCSPFNAHQHIHLSERERRGIQALVLYLKGLTVNKRNAPDLILDDVQALLDDAELLIDEHKNDREELVNFSTNILAGQGHISLFRVLLNADHSGYLVQQEINLRSS